MMVNYVINLPIFHREHILMQMCVYIEEEGNFLFFYKSRTLYSHSGRRSAIERWEKFLQWHQCTSSSSSLYFVWILMTLLINLIYIRERKRDWKVCFFTIPQAIGKLLEKKGQTSIAIDCYHFSWHFQLFQRIFSSYIRYVWEFMLLLVCKEFFCHAAHDYFEGKYFSIFWNKICKKFIPTHSFNLKGIFAKYISIKITFSSKGGDYACFASLLNVSGWMKHLLQWIEGVSGSN